MTPVENERVQSVRNGLDGLGGEGRGDLVFHGYIELCYIHMFRVGGIEYIL